MSKTQRPEIDTSMREEDRVRLKPIIGMEPGRYLAILYGLALLLILFILLLYPGLSRPGSVILVRSEPWGAAIILDGAYMAASPAEIFAPRGQRQLELRLPGFEPAQVQLEVGGRVFASRFFPRREELHLSLQSINPAEALIQAAEEFAAWSLAGEPNVVYQIPLSLSEGVYRLAPAALDPAIREAMGQTLAASARFTLTRGALRDLSRAKILLDSGGISPSPISLLGSAGDLLSYLEANPRAALALAELLRGEEEALLRRSPWYAQAQISAPVQAGPVPASGAVIQAGPLAFRFVPSDSSLSPGPFYISRDIVSIAAWEAFLEEEPHWGQDNMADLLDLGLVSHEYLELIFYPGRPSEEISAVSWHAAAAFCNWLSSSLPPGFESWELRLPTEAEWEYAARAGAIAYGDFWEWCAEPFAPLSYLKIPPGTREFSPERPLRGGSWINSPGSVDLETRASLPPHFSSPFVSFRPVIAPLESSP
ncbi:MAG: SUMF1/EgtB/PvdO family nonheme iron enzyme [Treponema sp.]|nr:SUMF1/EgtB/PvdO family nonheme iron enzyme [Treponema sp.]